MINQVVFYDRLNNTVKLIDGLKAIPLNKAQEMGFTPAYLLGLAHQIIDLKKRHNSNDRQAAKLIRQALKVCPTTKWDRVGNIVAYDRMTDKIRVLGDSATVPRTIAQHKGFTPAHLTHMACELLSVNHANEKSLKSAEEAEEACRLAQQTEPQYKNQRYR